MFDMSNVPNILWLIPALPLAASVLITLLGPRFLRGQSHWPCILAIFGSFVVAAIVLVAVHGAVGEYEHQKEANAERLRAPQAAGEKPEVPKEPASVSTYYTWFRVGEPDRLDLKSSRPLPSVDAGFSLRADPLSAIMVVMITFVGGLIAVFAVGYMHGEGGYPRFFAEIALFVFSMTTLVLADNFLLLYAGWEGVGVCSYLLIGFWFARPAAAAAARKAFLVTRIGDIGLMLGILLLWWKSDYHLDYDQVFKRVDAGAAMFACLLLFCGAAGKSAQFPLHVWLPDAMEGPTPVSALIHAATMVTAGVYLVARCTPLFLRAPEAQLLVGGIGAFTAILAALIALTQNDLKRVLAYSTLSQLGYMFLALGCGIRGTPGLVTFAVVAAMFHLFTHAFFKALLFLSAGSVMHAMGGVIDMRRFSGLRRVLPITHWTFLCGALTLAGFPLLSGFWSKDEILSAAYFASEHSSDYGSIYFVLFITGVVTAALTAFYTFRAYFRTFWGELVVPPEAGSHGHGSDDAHAHGHGEPGHTAPGHEPPTPPAVHEGQGQAHESPPVMTIPLVILSVFAVAIGGVLGPLAHWFDYFVKATPGFPALPEDAFPPEWGLMGLSSVLAVGGIAVAWLMYVLRPALPGKLAKAAQGLYQLSLNKFHFDELYNTFILKPLKVVTWCARIFDQYVIDNLVDLVGWLTSLLGSLFQPVQNGLVQFYALAMVLGLTVFLLALVRSL
jgi:NADH-quinone oxidoreductase subunit L